MNDFAVEQGKPWIYAAAVGAYAATMNILPGETACLACLFPKPPGGTVETCDTAGILNTAVNFAASVEVTEAMKFLVGARAQMRRTLLGRDLWSNDQAEISAAAPRCRMRRLPATRLCPPAGRGSPPDHAMRPQFRTDS